MTNEESYNKKSLSCTNQDNGDRVQRGLIQKAEIQYLKMFFFVLNALSLMLTLFIFPKRCIPVLK